MRLDGGVADEVAVRIAGDIVLSPNPGRAIRRWREFFGISQADLAARLGTSPSVISDYESGRRKSPGSQFIKRLVRALIEIDLERGGHRVGMLSRQIYSGSKYLEAILDMRDFERPITLIDFVKAIGAELVVEPGDRFVDVHGYTVVDSLKLVLEVPSHEYLRLYGSTTQRAAIFSNVTYGRSPLVAVKSMLAFTDLRPAVVVLHGVEKPDRLGVEIARREKIPLAIVNVELEELLARLRSIKA